MGKRAASLGTFAMKTGEYARNYFVARISPCPFCLMICACCNTEASSINEEFQSKFNIHICQNCIQSDKNDNFSMLTKTEAQQTYLLTDEELNQNSELPFIIKPNPKRSHWAKMHLYLRYQVEQFAIKKWGSLEEISQQHNVREEQQNQRKRKKFESELKKLRKAIAKPKGTKSSSFVSHEHEFVEVSAGSDGTKVRVKECKICRQQVEFEEL